MRFLGRPMTPVGIECPTEPTRSQTPHRTRARQAADEIPNCGYSQVAPTAAKAHGMQNAQPDRADCGPDTLRSVLARLVANDKSTTAMAAVGLAPDPRHE
jgi:hypothetical protein